MILFFVGAQEIAAGLGLSRQRVYQLAEREDFPEPYQTLVGGRIWKLSDILKWTARDGRTWHV